MFDDRWTRLMVVGLAFLLGLLFGYNIGLHQTLRVGEGSYYEAYPTSDEPHTDYEGGEEVKDEAN